MGLTFMARMWLLTGDPPGLPVCDSTSLPFILLQNMHNEMKLSGWSVLFTGVRTFSKWLVLQTLSTNSSPSSYLLLHAPVDLPDGNEVSQGLLLLYL